MLTEFSEPLLVEPQPSRILQALTITVHFVALMPVVLLPMPGWGRLLAGLLAALFLLALVTARARGKLDSATERAYLKALRHLPAAMTRVLSVEEEVLVWAKRFASKEHALFLGRGIHWPIAM